MEEITLNGVDYIRKDLAHGSVKVGIAVTTHNRNEIFAANFSKLKSLSPSNAVYVVVDDGSQIPIKEGDYHLIRNNTPQGIVKAKNQCLEYLMAQGCDQLFLFDDDAYPKVKGWELSYINSGWNHLAYQFKDLSTSNKLKDMGHVIESMEIKAYTGQRGVMLYFTRKAIETVGGFDPIYGKGFFEHPDLAMRIHHAGLTLFPFADVADSHDLIYSMDEHQAVTRSVPNEERRKLCEVNRGIYNGRVNSFYDGVGYVDYRKKKSALISVAIEMADPQRNNQVIKQDVSSWLESAKGKADVVKCIDVEPQDKMFPVYFQRWYLAYNFLFQNPDITHVFITDATDVIVLRSPFDDMDSGIIYVGDEQNTYIDPWFSKNHKRKDDAEWVEKNKQRRVFNAGILGGSRADVMDFIRKLLSHFQYDCMSNQFYKTERTVVDMVAFGRVADSYGDKVVTGPLVNTVFKSNGVGKDKAWFQHK